MSVLENSMNTLVDIFIAEAEGFDCVTNEPFFHFVQIAIGSHNKQEAAKKFAAFLQGQFYRGRLSFHRFNEYILKQPIVSSICRDWSCAARQLIVVIPRLVSQHFLFPSREEIANIPVMSTSIEFLGGAGTVTGSKYLVRHAGKKILVDCGLFQGLKTLRVRNWNPLPVNVAEIDAVVLTHAHVDHSGYIPRLVKDGYRGKIYATDATFDLCKILLPDSGYLMEEEAAYLNKRQKTKHSPALPLFSQAEAEDSLQYFEPVAFNTRVELSGGISFEFAYAGHIFGAAQVIMNCDGKTIAFSGDIGRMQDPLLYPPAKLPGADYLVIESTYGNRLHLHNDIASDLEKIICETHAQGGVIIIPAFAVGRAQILMYHLAELRKAGRIPEFPMYLNSPMAESASDLLMKYRELHRLSVEDCDATCNIVKYVRTPEHSRWLNDQHGPMLIISASGMLTGGRVLHHIKAFAGDERNVILLTGFQAAGTRGEALQRGVAELKIHGDYVPIRAQVRVLENISAHADYGEILKWLEECNIGPKRVFVTHGEAVASDELRRRLIDKFGWHAMVPDHGQIVQIP